MCFIYTGRTSLGNDHATADDFRSALEEMRLIVFDEDVNEIISILIL